MMALLYTYLALAALSRDQFDLAQEYFTLANALDD